MAPLSVIAARVPLLTPQTSPLAKGNRRYVPTLPAFLQPVVVSARSPRYAFVQQGLRRFRLQQADLKFQGAGGRSRSPYGTAHMDVGCALSVFGDEGTETQWFACTLWPSAWMTSGGVAAAAAVSPSPPVLAGYPLSCLSRSAQTPQDGLFHAPPLRDRLPEDDVVLPEPLKYHVAAANNISTSDLDSTDACRSPRFTSNHPKVTHDPCTPVHTCRHGSGG